MPSGAAAIYNCARMNKGSIVFCDKPALRLVSLFFFLNAVFVLVAVALSPPKKQWEQFAIPAIGLVMAASGVGVGRKAKQIDVIFDENSGELQILISSWFQQKSERKNFNVKEIDSTQVVCRADGDGDTTYQLALILHSGESIPLSGWIYVPNSLEEKRSKLAAIICKTANNN